jgi:DivIVA domain-containing protein
VHVNDANGGSAAANGGRSAAPRLPLSPNAIRTKRFQQQGRRGYERADVDLYMSQVAADVQLWIDEATRQRAEVERLKDWIRAQHYHHAPGDGDPGTRISVEAVGVLARAQHHADLVVATAHDQARAIVGDADAQAQAMVEAARMEADRAAQLYRATAGVGYSPEGEELRRRLAILQTFLGTLTAVQAQLPAVQSQLGGLVAAFAYEVERLQDIVAGEGQPYDSHPISPAYGLLR